MKIGIGLPAYIPGAKRDVILEWARQADEAQFSSLGIIDRLAFGGYEPLIALTAAAAVTKRIRLMSTIIVSPLRNAAILAKQAASLDALSGGRLTLGLGVGAREDDFRAAQAPFEHRGTFMVKQIERMKRIWSGQPVEPGVGIIGPAPAQKGGPELLLGGYHEVPIRRAGRLADGFISGGIPDPNMSYQLYQIAEKSWKEAGRPGKPRYAGAIYVVLGEDAMDKGNAYLRSYYGARFHPPVSDPQAIQELIRAFMGFGMDELFLWPVVSELEQFRRIAELVGKMNMETA